MIAITMWITAILMISGLLSIPSASLLLADESPLQTIPSIGTGGESATTTDAPAPASQSTPPTMPEEPAPPAEEATDIQERGLLPGLTAPVAPSGTLQSTGSIAPTPSLNAIVQAIRITSKSISVNFRVPANVPVTVPIEISVSYNSSFRVQRLKKTYSPTTGLIISYREAEGDGRPRFMRLDITLRELVPNGQSFLVTKQFTLIPLYDVFVSDLRFFMASGCDRSLPTFNAKSEIVFLWHKPDNQSNIEMEKFSLGRAEAKGITQFSWARKEVSTQANLKEPAVYFDETDLFTLTSVDILNKYIDMVPGPTTRYHFFLKKKETGPTGRPRFSGGGCEAEITYTIIRALMPFDQF